MPNKSEKVIENTIAIKTNWLFKGRQFGVKYSLAPRDCGAILNFTGGDNMFKDFMDKDSAVVFSAKVFVTALTVGFAFFYALEKFI